MTHVYYCKGRFLKIFSVPFVLNLCSNLEVEIIISFKAKCPQPLWKQSALAEAWWSSHWALWLRFAQGSHCSGCRHRGRWVRTGKHTRNSFQKQSQSSLRKRENQRQVNRSISSVQAFKYRGMNHVKQCKWQSWSRLYSKLHQCYFLGPVSMKMSLLTKTSEL